MAFRKDSDGHICKIYDEIRYIKLNNSGVFVARIHVLYKEIEGLPEETFNYQKNFKEWKSASYSDILLGGERTVDLAKDVKLPEDALVRLKVMVLAGFDNIAEEEFIYKSNAGKTAQYTISGTTGSSTLKFDSCK